MPQICRDFCDFYKSLQCFAMFAVYAVKPLIVLHGTLKHIKGNVMVCAFWFVLDCLRFVFVKN